MKQGLFSSLKEVNQGEMFHWKIAGVFQKEMHRSMVFCMLCANRHNTLLKLARVVQTVILGLDNSDAMHGLAK